VAENHCFTDFIWFSLVVSGRRLNLLPPGRGRNKKNLNVKWRINSSCYYIGHRSSHVPEVGKGQVIAEDSKDAQNREPVSPSKEGRMPNHRLHLVHRVAGLLIN
jgi:hypothetical protein